ncbi:hypothetical protein FHG66_11000 [Rubellimicrobium rubrum]|uniref:Uncharacterized protein n=1 Tax=Rubellimicrobium rubrum TaxID=2585369 RepID=A0A5C4MU82_9RHOB|nr:hypothetical protein [Rubellimicrobium rubrum]TNC49626.1 hypothetical protein FHG66_11000 [Rubellimicrobium rubrum]
MTNRKFSVAVAALLLGTHLGSPTIAAISEQDIGLVEAYVANGQAEELLAFLEMNPELLALQGALGDALRAFSENPSAQALQAVAALAASGQSLSALATTGQVGASIY